MENNKAGVRLAKRIILGKQKPPVVLRSLSWFTIGWSTLIGLFMVLAGVYAYIENADLTKIDALNDFTAKFCFSYAILHGLSIFSGILTYRKKRSGFYLYCISNISMVILPYILLNVSFLEDSQSTLIPIVFTVIMIALYLTQIKKME
jgi:hypothetical protein